MGIPIGELARRSGVNPSAIRYWERVGVLAAPARVAGKRLYPENAVRSVRLVRLGKEVGFTLAELVQLLRTRWRSPEWVAQVAAKREEVLRRSAQLERMSGLLQQAIDCGCREDERVTCLFSSTTSSPVSSR